MDQSDDSPFRRLMSSGRLPTRGEPINMSLVVIYSWLSLVVIMIVITVIIYKYKEPVSYVSYSRARHCISYAP